MRRVILLSGVLLLGGAAASLTGAAPMDSDAVVAGEHGPWWIFMLVVLLVVGFAGSAVFSGLETAIYSMSQLRLLVRIKEGDPRSKLVRDELSHRPQMIVCLLVANNAFNFLISFSTTSLMTEVLGFSGGWSIFVQAVVLTPFLFAFGETIPKEIGRSQADAIVPRFAPALWFVRRLLSLIGIMWLVRIIEAAIVRLSGVDLGGKVLSGRARLVALLEEGVSHGTLSAKQTEIVDRVLALRHMSTRECMTPWQRVRPIPISARASELRKTGVDGRYPYHPAVDSTGQVVGWVDLTRLLSENPSALVRDHVFGLESVSPRLDARHAIGVIKRAQGGLALVGSPRRPLGIVTMKDLVQPLLGSTTSATRSTRRGASPAAAHQD